MATRWCNWFTWRRYSYNWYSVYYMVWLLYNNCSVFNLWNTDCTDSWDSFLYNLCLVNEIWYILINILVNWDDSSIFLFTWYFNINWNFNGYSHWDMDRNTFPNVFIFFLNYSVWDFFLLINWVWYWVVIIQMLFNGNWALTIACLTLRRLLTFYNFWLFITSAKCISFSRFNFFGWFTYLFKLNNLFN